MSPITSEPNVLSMLNEKIDVLDKSLNRRLDAQDKSLGRIEGQLQATSGRVTVLERARERAQGVMFAFSWLPPVLASVVTAGLTILTLVLTGQVH